ncbi:hypothetical protein V1527DRAFT_486132 [Lipomyces starkeyi]
MPETSYNRHVLYCRRAQNRPRIRVRSCRACITAKVKCNFQPRCLRCTNKGFECVYDKARSAAAAAAAIAANAANAGATVTATNESQVADEQPAANVAPAFTLASLPDDDITSTLHDLCASSGATNIDETQIDVDWDGVDFAVTDIPSQSPESNLPRFHHEPALEVMPNASFLHGENLLLTELPWSSRSLPDEYFPALSGPTCLSERPYSDFLAPIPISDPVSKFTANIVMQMLCAFPQMMLRRETLPPFIHGHWYRPSDATESSLPKPLVNCMGLAQVFASRNLETRPFLWRTVKAEQRSSAEKGSQHPFSRDELLAAIQALLVYIIMRVIDNSKIEPDLNLELLVTYQGLCESFKDVCNEPFYRHEREYPSSSWEDWVFAESRRRTVIVWLLMTQMIQIKIGVPCDTFESFRDIPLSSPKSLWEARTRSGWQAEYEVYKTMPRMGLDVFGDLIDACRQIDVGSNKLKLHAWNATVDNLGILLNLSAAMI